MNSHEGTAQAAARQFAIYGELLDVCPFGGGHINNTFVSRWNQGGALVRYTHQRINSHVFNDPPRVMENICRVTNHIARNLAEEGVKDCSRRVLSVVPARDGGAYARDGDGGFWRSYFFIEGAHTRELAAAPDEARVLGESIGRFQRQLADLSGPRLYEVIPDFHTMQKRYERFYAALNADAHNRARSAAAEIQFMKENEDRGGILIRALRDNLIPERITHNDTKMNNILLDTATGEALCVIDLDTVMPGTSLFDVGDLIRTVANNAREDERDIAKVSFNLVFFEALLDGYLSRAAAFLNASETALLAESGRNITQIMGLRFLTDYLEGDHYYHIEHAEHNLERCRTQIALIKSMDASWSAALAAAEKQCRHHGAPVG